MVNISPRAMIGVPGATMLPIVVKPGADSAQQHDAHQVPLPPFAASCGNSQQTTHLLFNGDEAAFIEAAVARLIPRDDQWGVCSRRACRIKSIRSWRAAWGAGERLDRSGPWQPGTPSQGYQLPFTPAELFRNALRAITKKSVRAPIRKDES